MLHLSCVSLMGRINVHYLTDELANGSTHLVFFRALGCKGIKCCSDVKAILKRSMRDTGCGLSS